jgi:hypothetical protein
MENKCCKIAIWLDSVYSTINIYLPEAITHSFTVYISSWKKELFERVSTPRLCTS